MIKIKPKIWHYLLLIWLLLVITRYELVYSGFYLLYKYIVLLFTQFDSAINLTDLLLLDLFFSILMLIALPIIILFFKNKMKYLERTCSFSIGFILLLIIAFIFAPVITDGNPDFQKNLNVTKLLPPFSKVKVLQLKNKSVTAKTFVEEFTLLKNSIVKNSYDESIIFIDSIDREGKNYYQANNVIKINKDVLLLSNGKPETAKKLFLLGTDEYGRDILTRIIYGARISLLVGVGSVICSLIIGALLGFLAGYLGGIIDVFLSRITDMFLTFPTIFLIILILAFFGNNLLAVIKVLGFTGWMSLFKIVKSEVISIKNKDFFITSRMLGLSNFQLLKKEIFPLIITPLVVNIIFQFSNVIFAESALSYLGLGAGINHPSWGAMIESGQEYLSKAWWISFSPAMILILTMLCVNNVGAEINKYYNPRITDVKR